MNMGSPIKINAPEHNIEQVTVYSDRAVIRRRFPVELQTGQNEVAVSRLPASLESDSIRVETETTSAFQSLTVFDVVHAPPGSPQNPNEDSIISGLEERVAAVQSRRTLLTQQEKVLSSYSDTLSSQYTNAGQLASFLDLHRTTSGSISNERTALDKEHKSLSKELDDVRKRTNSEIEAKKASSVTVTVLSEAPGPAQLILIYAVYGASWSSLYDVRASVDSYFASKKADSPTISLQYRASIIQHTGEDWNDVALTLSTAAPLIGSEMPELVPWRIAPAFPAQPTYLSSYAMPAMALSRHSVGDDYGDEEMLMEFKSAKPQKFRSRSRAVVVQGGAVSSVFHIEGRSTIPSDNLSHKVSIAVLDLVTEFEWVTVPRKVTSAYLKCRIKNTSDFLLIGGPSHVFMDGNFVSKSSIPSVSPQETFSCSLGVDPSLRITYHPQKKTVSTTGGSLLSRSQKMEVTAYWQRISIKNTRPTTISRLTVKDQVPTSENARIKVLLINPNEKQMGPMNPSSITSQSSPIVARAQIKDDIVARWAPKNEDGTGGPKGDGVIEWVCTDVGEELDIYLAYEISAPQNAPWR